MRGVTRCDLEFNRIILVIMWGGEGWVGGIYQEGEEIYQEVVVIIRGLVQCGGSGSGNEWFIFGCVLKEWLV